MLAMCPMVILGSNAQKGNFKKNALKSYNSLLKDYHTASILLQAKAWFTQLHNPTWLELEKMQTPGKTLADLLLTCRIHSHIHLYISPTMEATLQAWKTFSSLEFTDQVMKPLPLTILSLLLIIPDLHITQWMAKGIKVEEDLMVGPTPRTFRALQIEYGLVDNDQYRYLQIVHFLHKIPKISILLSW